ncbi:PREDICTED: fatty acid synthase-like [Priapulus caudatus]|uniref:Fatty acid synthase-like n=1 Tax=Priapulus caudatus TaxID=37621 RepID=A0ABM1EJB4_PRICU|nr:PREDICTED: fatty acid synthase-like [Priapulus caudatus]
MPSSNIACHHRGLLESISSSFLENVKKAIPNPRPKTARWRSTSIRPSDDAPKFIHDSCSAEFQLFNILEPIWMYETFDSHVPHDALVIEVSMIGFLVHQLERTNRLQNRIVVGLMDKKSDDNAQFFKEGDPNDTARTVLA